MQNPFNPSFGRRPERFIGREEITRSIVSSVDDTNSPCFVYPYMKEFLLQKKQELGYI